MKVNRFFVFVVIFLVPIALFAQKPKVAVLDAVMHSGVKESIAIPITESIIEELVASGKYTVLDRAHVAKIMEEKKFQVSGIVKSADIKLVGNYLGADIIAVIDISLIEDIYFVSAKMIDVESGEIRNQASHKKRGDVSVIFEIAETVGVKLAGGKVAVADAEDPALNNYVAGDLRLIEYKLSADNKLVFYTYDMTVSGMKGKKIHVEFWISQGKDWMPNSKVTLDPEEVLYDPAYWNDNAHTFSYPLEMFTKFGDMTKPYWGTFYIIDTTADSIIFTKDIQFTLPAANTGTTNYTDTNGTDLIPAEDQFFSRSAISYLYPVFFGNINDIFGEFVFDEISPAFFDLHMMTVLDNEWYISGLLSINSVTTTYAEFVALAVNSQVGMGLMYPIARDFQGFYGARFGLYYLVIDSFFDTFNGDGQLGFSMTFETGVDLLLGDEFTLNLRGQYEAAFFDEGDIFPDIALNTDYEYDDLFVLNSIGFSIGIGFAY